MERPTKLDKQPISPSSAEQQLFMGTVLSMSWQLLIVVVVPFIGGHYLDTRYAKTPLFTLLGIGLALALATLVVYRNYQILTTANKERTTVDD